jgi:aminoglycoside 6'-N-acetyltransferase I
MSVTVRPVVPADATAWSAMRAALWPDEDPAALAAEVDAFLAGRVAHLEHVLVAEVDGVVAGMAELNRRAYAEGCTSSPVAFLEGWYVAPAARRQGVGGALVDAALAWARGAGCSEFASDTLADNALSRDAHLGLGFEEVEVLRCFRKAL